MTAPNPIERSKMPKLNWSESEKEKFLRIVKELDGGKAYTLLMSGAGSNLKRHELWVRIQEIFNRKTGKPATVDKLRKLFQRLKSADTACLNQSSLTFDGEPDVSEFKLSILDFGTKQPSHTKFKAVLSSVDKTKVQQQPVVVSMQVLELPNIRTEEILNSLNKFEFCPGIEENQILPLLSQFGNGSFACIMFLIEKIEDIVVYRSRDCEIILEGNERLCSFCRDLYQDLEFDSPVMEPFVKMENETEEEEVEMDELITDTTLESQILNKVSEEVENSSSEIQSNKLAKLNWSEDEKDTFLRVIKELDGGKVYDVLMNGCSGSNLERHAVWVRIQDIFNRETGKPATVKKLRTLFKRLNSKSFDAPCLKQSSVEGNEQTTSNELKRRFKISKNYSCKDCGKTFFSENGLFVHNSKLSCTSKKTEEGDVQMDLITDTLLESEIRHEMEDKSSESQSNKLPKVNWSESEKEIFLRIIQDLDGGNVYDVLMNVGVRSNLERHASWVRIQEIFNKNTGKPATVLKLRSLFQRLNSKNSEKQSSVEGDEQTDSNESTIKSKISKSYSCKDCAETFFSENGLCVHISKLSCLPPANKEDSNHPCSLCKKSFNYETMLAIHCKKEHGIGYHIDCPFCDEHFDISDSVEDCYNHLVTSHSSEIQSDAFIEIVDEFTQSKRLCQKCSKTFKSKTAWLFHIKRWHGEPDPIACHLCGKIVKLKMDMVQHLKTHVEDKSVCQECGAILKNKMYLAHHMMTHNKIPFPCEECGKKFFTKQNLKEHVEYTHLKKRPFSCEFCGKGFATRFKVKCHIRSIHTKEKPYSCEGCDYTCSRSDGLRAHRNNVHNK